METNALYICDRLIESGWSLNAISGLLGNTQSESGINSGIWENLDNSDVTRGYGLVQWTPSTKFTNWCIENDYDILDMGSAVNRIKFEVENNIQFTSTTQYGITFAEFTISEDSAYNLGIIFLHNYEKPTVIDTQEENERGEQSQNWYVFLTENYHPTVIPTEKTIYELLQETSFNNNTISDNHKLFLQSIYVGDIVEVVHNSNHGKLYGTTNFGSRFRSLNKTFSIYGVTKNGMVLVGNTVNYKSKIKPKYIKGSETSV